MDPSNGKGIGVFNLICGQKNLKDKLIFKMTMMAHFGLPMKNLNNTFLKFKFANIITAIIFRILLHL
jgi:hypothetical protein